MEASFFKFRPLRATLVTDRGDWGPTMQPVTGKAWTMFFSTFHVLPVSHYMDYVVQ